MRRGPSPGAAPFVFPGRPAGGKVPFLSKDLHHHRRLIEIPSCATRNRGLDTPSPRRDRRSGTRGSVDSTALEAPRDRGGHGRLFCRVRFDIYIFYGRDMRAVLVLVATGVWPLHIGPLAYAMMGVSASLFGVRSALRGDCASDRVFHLCEGVGDMMCRVRRQGDGLWSFQLESLILAQNERWRQA